MEIENGTSCAVLRTGGLKCWGDNASGLYGNGTYKERHTPVTIGGIRNAVSVSAGWRHTCVQIAGGVVRCTGENFAGELGDGTFFSRKRFVRSQV